MSYDEHGTVTDYINIGTILYFDEEEDQAYQSILELYRGSFSEHNFMYKMKISVFEDGEHSQNRVVLANELEMVLINNESSVIVKINDEIITFSKEQYKIVRKFLSGDISENPIQKNRQGINISISDPGIYFQQDDHLFYVYEEIINDPKNIRLRVKLGYHLIDELIYFERSGTVGDLIRFIKLCEDNLNKILGIKANKNDKLNAFIKSLSFSQLGFLKAIQGDLAEATKNYFKANEIYFNNTTLRNNISIKKLLGCNAINLVSLLVALNAKEISKKIYNLYTDEIEYYISTSIDVIQSCIDKVRSEGRQDSEDYFRKKLEDFLPLKNELNKIILIRFDEDINELLEEDDDDQQYDSYNFFDLRAYSVKDIQEGHYKDIFSTGFKNIEHQRMKVKAYF